MSKLDDDVDKTDSGTILDMSKQTITTKEEFKKLLDKVPDYKIRPEKVRREDIKIHDKDFKFKTGKKDYKAMKAPYTFLDPLPPDVSSLNVCDFAPVPIDWKMLTTLRPKTKTEEEMFSRLIELGKLQLKTVQSDKRQTMLHPLIRRSKNRAGVIETRAINCNLCGEDFCNGRACSQYNYDSFSRIEIPEAVKKPSKTTLPILDATNKKGKKGKTKRKSGTKSKSRKSTKKSTKTSKSRSKSPRKNTEK